jgi:hypothetical protein
MLMLYRRGFAVSIMLLCCLVAAGKDKKKALLPADILRAQTVLVMVDPEAGVDAQDPNANRAARENVEMALAKWGRLRPLPGGSNADLIIVIRKGNGKTAQPTIGGTPARQTPPVIGQSTGSIRQIGVQAGNAPGCDVSDPQCGATDNESRSNDGPGPSNPRPQMDVGPTKDTFAVYRGGPDPLDAPAVWRYTAKDALDAPDVRAVEAFQKLVAESEKQLANKP